MGESYRLSNLMKAYWELVTLNAIPEQQISMITLKDSELQITAFDKIVTKKV